MTRELILDNDPARLYVRTARHIVSSILQTMHETGGCVLGIVGGRSMPDILMAVGEELRFTASLHTATLDVIWLDERLDPDKNFSQTLPFFEGLLHVGIIVRFHPIVALDATMAEHEIKRCAEAITKTRGRFAVDVAILSAGEDGHIASLFPHSPALSATGMRYVLVDNAPKPPALRVTVTPEVLFESHVIFLFFVGEKRAAYEAFQNPASSPATCPAVLVRDHHRLKVCVALSSTTPRRKL